MDAKLVIVSLPSLLSVLLLLFISSVSSEFVDPTGLCDNRDKKVLLAFMNAFGQPPRFPSWSDNTPCCDWPGVTCNTNTSRVIGLDISEDDDLSGPIPSALFDLPYLDNFRLHKLPNLVGSIPRKVTQLKRLRFLTVSWANLSGPVPSFLADLPSLEQLDLSFNNLTGSIPASLGGPQNLYAIDLSRNHLTGSIPASLLQRAQPATLILSHNQLTGPIPRSFGSVDFQSLDLSRNQLTGDASFLFGKSKGANNIVVSRNQLEFDLSSVEFPESSLYNLDLSHNMITGSISPQIANVPTLQLLNVSYNRLCGPIPTGGQMGEFDGSSYIHNKCLCGTPLGPCK